MSKSTIYLIGAGPGDPGLFTLKGKMLLEKADVVVYDRLVSNEILYLARQDAELIYVGKESGRHAMSQAQINEVLIDKAKEGKMVVRLKGGDPFLYGRGGEEAEYIKEKGFNYEVIPGITSAIAVPAYAGIPVTHRDATSSFAVITGHEKPGKKDSSIKWPQLATGIGTLVFLMGIENIEYISSQLIQNGRSEDTPIALIRWGTRPEQEVLTGNLGNIVKLVKDSNFQPPAVIVVGEVVNLRNKLKWFENKPLWGKKIVVTRARKQASALVQKIQSLGGIPLEFPTIEIVKKPDLSELKLAQNNLQSYNWIIFTSANAVDIFFDELSANNHDIRDLYGVKLGAIGPATKEKLRCKGLKVDLMPEEYVAEGILQAMSQLSSPGERVLMPRAEGARDILPKTLAEKGLKVDEIIIYSARPASGQQLNIIEKIVMGEIDYLTFTSSSTVQNFVEIVGPEKIKLLNDKVTIVCIGPITAEKARESGLTVNFVAGKYTIEGLLEVILDDAASKRGGENNYDRMH